MTLPKNVDDLYQLSPMQHLMLLRTITDEGSGVLLNQVCYDVRGPLDVEHFRLAWKTMVARHPALRTAFLWEGLPHPVQVVRASVPLNFSVIDLSTISPDERTLEAERRQRADAQSPLAIGRAPLMRCTVVKLSDEHHRILWTIHHLVIDRWSHALLLRELCSEYWSRQTGGSAPLAAAPRYRDYVAWIAQQDPASAARYWQEVVGDVRRTTRLADGGRPHGPAARVTTRHALTASASAALRERAVRWGATPAAVWQSAIGLLLAGRNGYADVVYGLTVSGRPHDLADASVTVGSFVNNVPVRLHLNRDQAVASLVRAVHRGEGRRLPFSYVSPIQIQEWSAVPLGRPLFDTLVLLNLSDDERIEWPGLEFVCTSATLDAAYPFLLAVGAVDGAYAISLVHDAEFDGAVQILTELEQLVAQVAAADDGSTVGDMLPSLSNAAAPIDERTTPRAEVAPHLALPRGGPAGEDLATSLLQAWREVLGIEELGLDDDFFVVGGTSMQAAQLFTRIERIAGKSLPLSTLFRAGSVRALLEELDRPMARRESLVRLRSSGRRPPLYAVPGIGGNIVSLSGLARHLGPDQPFSAFESPGVDGRETPLTSIAAIAERYVEELWRAEAGPIHLLGICWGAAVAFEMGRLLHQRGRPAASMALMEPAVLLRESPALALPGDLSFVRARLELYWSEFRAGNWRDRSRLLASKARRVTQALSRSEVIEESALERTLFRVREANTRAVTGYLPLPYDGVARLFLTTDRDLRGGDDWRLEWSKLIRPTPSVVTIGGFDAGDAISPTHAGGFAAALRSWLDTTADSF